MNKSSTPTSYPEAQFLLFLSFGVLAFFGLRTISNPDFWMHLAVGRTLAESGWIRTDPFSFTTTQSRIWINPTWMYDAALYRIWQLGGAAAVTIATLTCILAAFALLLPLARRGAGGASQALAILLIAWLMAPILTPSPAVPALLATALTIRILSVASTRTALFILIPVQIIWTNMHGSFLLGPLLAALYWWESARATKDNRLAIWLPVALLAATLANPYGIQLHKLAFKSIVDPNAAALIQWISPFQADFAPFFGRHAATLLLAVIASAFIAIPHRLPLVPTTLGVFGAFLLVISPRYYLFSGLFVFPFAACGLQGIATWLTQRAGNDKWAVIGRGIFFLFCLATILVVGSNYYFNRSGSSSTFGLGITQNLYPERASEVLLSHPDFPKHAVNLAHDGGYLAWRLPRRKIFTDTRAPVYGIPFYQGLAGALGGHAETWNALIQRFDIGAVILNGTWAGSAPAARRLIDSGQWALAYWDGTTIVLLRRTDENAALIADPSIQQSGLAHFEATRRIYRDRLAAGGYLQNEPSLISAGQFLFSLGRFDEARSLLSDVVQGSPTFSLAWQLFGVCLERNGDRANAILALERATQLRPDNVLSWLWLARVLNENGDSTAAAEATKKAHKLNPKFAEAFEKANPSRPESTPSE